MRLDKFSNPIFNSADIFKILYTGKISDLKHITVDYDDEVAQLEKTAEFEFQKFNNQIEQLDISEFDQALQSDWFMPPEYKEFNVEEFCLNRCTTVEQGNRVLAELAAFEERGMIPLLQWAKYFVDICTANDIVWGVGRGSSVASFVLFLLGVHQIDSVKYNLDWQEFLR